MVSYTTLFRDPEAHTTSTGDRAEMPSASDPQGRKEHIVELYSKRHIPCVLFPATYLICESVLP